MHEEQNGQRETISARDAVSLNTDLNIDALFEQLNPQDVEQFYQSYQLWSTQHRITQLTAQIAELQQQRSQNVEWMQHIQPSSIALSVLAQLQAHGVEDVDLLDRMLERGDEWLDHTMELLTRCEGMDMIQGDYARWCEHALEGAYDWIGSMNEAQVPPAESATTDETTIEETEALLLHKLMSDEEAAPESVDAVAAAEDEIVHEYDLATPDEEVSPAMDAVIEFALDEQPATADAETTTASRKTTGPLQPSVTGPLQAEDEITSQAQDESEAAVVDETEVIDDETIVSPQDESEAAVVDETEVTATVADETAAQIQDDAELTAADEAETIAITGDEVISQTQDDDAELTTATEDETVAQMQDDAEATTVTEDETAAQFQDDETEIATAAEDETGPQIHDDAETTTVTEDEVATQIQGDATELSTITEDEVIAQIDAIIAGIQDKPGDTTVPEDNPAAQVQPEDTGTIQQPEEIEAAPPPEDEAPTQVQAVEDPHPAEVSVEQPTETLSIIRRKLKIAPVDNNVEDQSQAEITQPLDEYIVQAAQHEQKLTQANADEHALPPIDEHPTLVNGQPPSPQPVNNQLQQPEPVPTASAAASNKATATIAPAPTPKKARRGWFSWLFRGRRRN